MALFFHSSARFGRAVRHLRMRRGWSQEQLGKRAGVVKSVIGNLEASGKAPSFAQALRIVEALGMELAIAPAASEPGKEEA